MLRRRFLAGAGIAFPSLLAGCLSTIDGADPDGTPDDVDDPDKAAGADDPLDPPRDLVLENQDTEPHTMTVVLTSDGEPIHNETYELDPQSELRMDEMIVHPGNYTLDTTLEDGATERVEWAVTTEVWHAYATITGVGELFLSADMATDDPPENGDQKDADTVPVLTGHARSDHVVAPSGGGNPDTALCGRFLATPEAAAAAFEDASGTGAEEVRDFVAATDFEAGDRLVYVQTAAPQTCYELVLQEEPAIAANGLPVIATEVARTAPADQPCGDAITTVALLLRLSFDLDAGSPDVVEIHVAEQDDEPVERLLEAER